MTITYDDGSWNPAPSGLNSGNLDAWRDRMHHECPDPKVGDIVLTEDKNNKKVGYRARSSEGYNTRWQRVSSEEVTKHIRLEKSRHVPNTNDYVYVCDGVDGVYVQKNNFCWF